MPEVITEPCPIETIFLEDTFQVGETIDLEGDFRRESSEAPIYTKPDGESAFVIGDEGENMLMVTHGKSVAVPMAPYQGDPDYIHRAVVDRMFALLDGTRDDPPSVAQDEVVEHFQERFKDSEGTVRTVRLYDDDGSTVIVGVLGHAGVIVRQDPRDAPEQRIGLMAFANRVQRLRVVLA